MRDRRPLRWTRRIAGAVIVGGLVAALIWWRTDLPDFGFGKAAYRSVAILPLRNASENPEESAYLVHGLGEVLASKLSGVSSLQVAPWVTSQRYPPGSMPPREIARELNVEALVVGACQKRGARLTIDVSLVDAVQEADAWSDEFEIVDADLLLVQDRIATAIARALGPELTGDEVAALARSPTASIQAYDLYLRGAYVMQGESRESNEEAMKFFQKALSIDPDLAEIHLSIGALHTERYFYGWGQGRRDLEVAEERFRTALQLEPGLMRARRGLIKVFWEQGRSEECLQLGHEVRNLSHPTVEGLMVQAQALWMGGLMAEAKPVLEKIVELDPANLAAHWSLVVTSAWASQPRAAIDAGEEFFRRFGEDPEVHLWVGASHLELNDHGRACGHIDRALELYADALTDYAHFFAGWCHRHAGDEARAEELFRTGIEILEGRVARSPENLRTRALLTLLHGSCGDGQNVRAEAVRLLTENPAPADVSALGHAHSALGDHATAVELLRSGLRQGHVESRGVGPALDVRTLPAYESYFSELNREKDRLRRLYAE